MAERDAGPGREGSARRCKEEAATDATDGLALSALALVGLGRGGGERMAPGRSSGFRAATPTLFHPTCLAARLQDAPYPAWGPSLHLSSVRDLGCQQPAAAGWPCLPDGDGGGGGGGESAATGQRGGSGQGAEGVPLAPVGRKRDPGKACPGSVRRIRMLL